MKRLDNPDFHAQAAWIGWHSGAQAPPEIMASMSVSVWDQMRNRYRIMVPEFAIKQRRMHKKMMAKQSLPPVNKPKRAKRERSSYIK
jgi:hypothetical protein